MEKPTAHCSALPFSSIEQFAVTVKIRAQLKMRQRHSEPFPEAKVMNYLQKEDFHIFIIQALGQIRVFASELK